MTDPYLAETARCWAIRVSDPRFDDWDGFTAWLEADPAHAAAYDAACDRDAAIGELFALSPIPAAIAPATAAPGAPHASRRRWMIGAGGAVAALIAVTLGYDMIGGGAATRTIATPAGVQRSIALADGTRITLNGASRITLDDDRPRLATLEAGEAVFEVHHDARDPFTVRVGGARLVDAGTVFDVAREAGETRVAVAEGAVVYNPDREAVRLDAGRALRITGDRVVLSDTARDTVGSWRSGLLVFADAPLDTVASALMRSTGDPVAIDPALGARRFTGTLAIGEDRADAVPRLAPLLGARAERRDKGWILMPSDRARP